LERRAEHHRRVVGDSTCSGGEAVTIDRRLGHKNKKGKGPGGLESHREYVGVLGLSTGTLERPCDHELEAGARCGFQLSFLGVDRRKEKVEVKEAEQRR
jgi:hypothetical protein